MIQVMMVATTRVRAVGIMDMLWVRRAVDVTNTPTDQVTYHSATCGHSH